MWSASILSALLDANIAANAAYIGVLRDIQQLLDGLRRGAAPLFPLVFGGAIGLALGWRIRGTEPWVAAALVWVVLWLAAAGLDVVLLLKFWSHYLNTLIPPLCLLAAFVVDSLAQQRDEAQRFPRPVSRCSYSCRQRTVTLRDMTKVQRRTFQDVPRLVAHRIVGSARTGTVYVFNYEPIIYYLTDAPPPTRYVLLPAHIIARELALEVRPIMSLRPSYILVTDSLVFGPLAKIQDIVEGEFGEELWAGQRIHRQHDGGARAPVPFAVIQGEKVIPIGDRAI